MQLDRLRGWLSAIYILWALIGLVLLVVTMVRFPAELPRLSYTPDMTTDQIAGDARAIVAHIDEALPMASPWLAPGAMFGIWDRGQALIAPNRWQRENTSLENRAARFNRKIDALPGEHRRAVILMGVLFLCAVPVGLFARFRPGLGNGFLAILLPVFATPVVGEPLAGIDNPDLMYAVLPLVLAGVGLLALDVLRYARDRDGRRTDDFWILIWYGLFLVALGGTATALSAAWVFGNGGGVLFATVIPILIGLINLVRGVRGLIHSKR